MNGDLTTPRSRGAGSGTQMKGQMMKRIWILATALMVVANAVAQEYTPSQRAARDIASATGGLYDTSCEVGEYADGLISCVQVRTGGPDLIRLWINDLDWTPIGPWEIDGIYILRYYETPHGRMAVQLDETASGIVWVLVGDIDGVLEADARLPPKPVTDGQAAANAFSMENGGGYYRCPGEWEDYFGCVLVMGVPATEVVSWFVNLPWRPKADDWDIPNGVRSQIYDTPIGEVFVTVTEFESGAETEVYMLFASMHDLETYAEACADPSITCSDPFSSGLP